MFTSRHSALVVLGIGVLVLSGCTRVDHSAEPRHSAAPSASASPSTTSTKPTLSHLVVSPNGLGDLVPGQPVPADSPATAVMTWDATKCVDAAAGITPGSPGAGAWLAAYPDAANFDGASWPPFDITPTQARTDPTMDIQIWSPELKTAQHIGVGSSLIQLQSAYGTSLTVDSADNSDVYTLRGMRGQLMFEFLKGPDNVGEPEGVVAWMQIIPLSVAPFHIANSDGAGPCSE